MEIINSFGKEDLAKVYIADFGDGRIAEFVESLQPPIPREEKWVLIISTSFGCSVNCIMCDAGGVFKGRCSTEQMFQQLDYLISQRYPDLNVPVKKFKVQFARMGEPAFNKSVLDVLEHIVNRYDAPGLMPCISTIAPANTNIFFERLLEIKDRQFSGRDFQLQFSLHSTDKKERDQLMPIPKWTLEQIANYGEKFFAKGGRRITLNFALIQGMTLDVHVMAELFSPEYFMIKLLISIGENEENLIGSNCGQYVMKHLAASSKLQNSYTYVNTFD
jgi:23S rRNA (adenine2503-C2)-methyltransferase